MKRFLIHLILCLASFSLGITVMTLRQRYARKLPQLEPVARTKNEILIHGHFSIDDLIEIRKLIAGKTSQNILSIVVEENKNIEVTTGVVRSGVDGEGLLFQIKKENDQWIITYQTSWIA
ncbi:MAG: hypothetical protein U0Y68_20255 [Blastocatellia bacterium]